MSIYPTFRTLKPLIMNSNFIVLVAPVSVLIVNKGDQLVVGEPSDIVCRSSGSRPPAHITWYLDGRRIEGGTESVSFFLVLKLFYFKIY